MLKFQRLLLGLFILMIPIIYPLHAVDNIRDFQQSLFQYGVMIAAVFFVRNIWLALFFCWTIFLYYLNDFSCGHETVYNVFFGVILFGISRQLYSKYKFDKEARWILAVGLISLTFMALQFLTIDPLHTAMTKGGEVQKFVDFNDPVGIFTLKAHNGIYLALLVPILAMIHPILGLAMLFPIKFCESSGAILAAIGSLLFYLWFDKRKIDIFRFPLFRWFWMLVIFIVIAGGLFFYKDYRTDPKMYGSRLNIWHLTFRQSLMRPIGFGPDSFRNITNHKNFMIMGDQDYHSAIAYPIDKDHYQFIYYDPHQGKMREINSHDPKSGYDLKSPNLWDHPHNEYLNLLFCWGWPGLILFFFLMKEICFRFIQSDKTQEILILSCMIIVYLLGSMVQFPLSVARLGYLFPLILGAYYAATERQNATS